MKTKVISGFILVISAIMFFAGYSFIQQEEVRLDDTSRVNLVYTFNTEKMLLNYISESEFNLELNSSQLPIKIYDMSPTTIKSLLNDNFISITENRYIAGKKCQRLSLVIQPEISFSTNSDKYLSVARIECS